MTSDRHRVFVSYHHANDQGYKESLVNWGVANNIFIDLSVDTGDISDALTDEAIREKIRDEYLRDSSITVVLVGTETKRRKHVDWEIYSSMYDGARNKKSGILVVNLPTINCTYFNAAHGEDEKNLLYPSQSNWVSITERTEYERRYPEMPDRIIDNLLRSGVRISVVNWDVATATPDRFRFLLDVTFRDRTSCNYDLSRQMRRSNS